MGRVGNTATALGENSPVHPPFRCNQLPGNLVPFYVVVRVEIWASWESFACVMQQSVVNHSVAQYILPMSRAAPLLEGWSLS